MGSLQEQRLMCSYYAGRKHSLHRNVTYSVTNEATKALNLACYSLMLRQSQPLACTTELGYLNRWPALKDRRGRGRTVSREGIVTSLPLEPSKGKGPVDFCRGDTDFLHRHAIASSGIGSFSGVGVTTQRLRSLHLELSLSHQVPAPLTNSCEGRKVLCYFTWDEVISRIKIWVTYSGQ